MIFDKQKSATVITRESVSLASFLERLKSSYSKVQGENLVINLISLDKFTLSDLLVFLELSNKHRKKKKSFVIVTDKINYDEIPDELMVVPTVQEAHDIIEMEEIERDLGF